VTVTDPSVSGLTCSPATPVANLAPGATINCTATHTISQADLDAGHFANTACVDDGDGGAQQACATKDVPGTPNPHLAITKTASPASYSTVGQVITYTIVATNDGNVTLHNVTVTDPSVSGLDCSPANGSSLAPGASMTCTATYVITQADIDAGHHANQACVDDGPGGAAQACASTDVHAARLSLSKVPTPMTYSAVGQSIAYFYTVTNSGNTNFTDPITVSDNKVPQVTCPAANQVGDLDNLFEPGESMICSGSYTITSADLTAGSVTNVATASANGTTSNQATATVHAVIVRVTKTADPGPVEAGNPIGFQISVTNSGTADATSVTVTDGLPTTAGLLWTVDFVDVGVQCNLPPPSPPNPQPLTCTIQTLAAGATKTIHISSPTTPATCGAVNNTATVTSTNGGGNTSSASVSVTCPTVGIVSTQALRPGDSATVTGGAITPTGTVTFDLFGPNDPTCAGTPQFSFTRTLDGNGQVATVFSDVAVSAPGTWRWRAHYSGDGTYIPSDSPCGSESFTINNG
jgi:uncharacterized repeat protein (TIGR01451 family)